ncbi:MAG: SDR family oxidoreductase [Alphaproteobacteria bacterium]|nr:SDR family oxidoreductase [Alphaproteobacteria bacterium]
MRIFMTGGNGGIGGAIKQKFINEGHEVFAPGSKDLDLNDSEAIKTWFTKNGNNFDVIVHSAGYNKPLPIEKMSLEEFNKTQNVNLTALLTITQQVLPYFKEIKRGYIVGIGSLYASISREERIAYTSSKHALVGMIQTLALELGKYNVLCNTVSPGYVDTKMFRANNSEEKRAYLASKIPLNRLAQPEDIADIVYFLAGPQNHYINGQDIIVDGGFMAGSFQ